MRFVKADTDIIIQAFSGNWPWPVDNKGRQLLGRFVGCVEILEDAVRDEDDEWEYLTNYYMAYQLTTGEILAVDGTPNNFGEVFSLKGKQKLIHFGWYAQGTPDSWKVIEPPKANCLFVAVDGNEDELPF